MLWIVVILLGNRPASGSMDEAPQSQSTPFLLRDQVPRKVRSDETESISERALNRALLARQLLLQRDAAPIESTLEHLVGMQAQEPLDPYLGLWSRLRGFDPNELGRLKEEREVVRTALMRSTIHLVTARDARALRPLIQPVLNRTLQGSWGRYTKKMDLDAVAAAGRQILEREPLAFAELGAELAKRWPKRNAQALAQVVRARIALVQVPPRGVWGKRGQARHAPLESWLGDPPGPTLDVEGMVRRYLAAFGPASAQDVQAWCGLTRMNEVLERLSPELALFQGHDGTPLYDNRGGPRPNADVSAEPRFLPQYDNLFLGHRDRSRLMGDAPRRSPLPDNAAVRHMLIDGYLAATWKVKREKRGASLAVEPFG